MDLLEKIQRDHATEKQKIFPNKVTSSKVIVSAEPCIIDSQNTLVKLHNEAQVKFWLKDIIPSYRQPGGAISAGDCFFHSIADCLNQRSDKEEYSIQSLRIFCDEYVKDLKNSWVKAENIKDREDHNNYLVRIRFSAQELLEKEKVGQKLGLATWGRPKIEGRIFCEQYNIRIHVIQIQEDGAIHRYLVDRNGETNDFNPAIDYQDLNILHVINYHNHFVPLLNINQYIPEPQRKILRALNKASPSIQIDSHVKQSVDAASEVTSSSIIAASTAAAPADANIEKLSLRRIFATIYTNSAAALGIIPPRITTSLQHLNIPSLPPPVISGSTVNIKNFKTEDVTATLAIDEKKAAQSSNSDNDKSRTTIINQYSAGLMVLVPEIPPLDMKELKNKLWNLPVRNSNFSGRKELLQELTERFQKSTLAKESAENDSKSVVVVVCHGIGGVGKTQVAIHLAYQQNNTIVHWITAETPTQIEAAYVALAKSLSIFEENQAIEEIIKNIKAWIMNHPRWLLIFDNAQNYSEIEKYIPEFGCDVLVTSRYTEWPAEIDVKIDIFSEKDSREYIKKILGNRSIDSEALIDQLGLVMGYLPLSLAQSCSYIRQNKMNIVAFLERYDQRKSTFLVSTHLPPGDKHIPVYVTWDISLDIIGKESKLAPVLLNLCAYLNTENIPYFLLQELAKIHELNSEDEDFQEQLGLLHRYSLVTINPDINTVSIHKVIQEVIQLKVKQANQEEYYIKKLVSCLNHLFSYTKYATTADEWVKTRKLSVNCEQLINHVNTLSNQISRVLITPEEGHSLLMKVAQYCIDVKSNYTLARRYIEKLTQLHECNFFQDKSLAKAELQRERANLFMALGEYKEAIIVFDEVLKVYETNAASENKVRLLGIIYYQLGNAYYFLHDYDKAESFYDQVLALRDKDLSIAESLNVAVAWHGKGNILGRWRGNGMYQETIEAMNRMLAIYNSISSSQEHKNFAIIYSVNALMSYLKGSYDKALDYYKKAHEIYVKVYGTELHIDIAINHYNTSHVLCKLKKYEDALRSAQSAAQVYFTILGKIQDFDLAIMLFQIGFLMCRQEKYQDGLQKYQEALSICVSIDETQNNKNCLNTFTKCIKQYSQNNKFKEAEQCYLIMMFEFYEQIKKKGTRASLIPILNQRDGHEINPLIPSDRDYRSKSKNIYLDEFIEASSNGDIDKIRELSLGVEDVNNCNKSGEYALRAAVRAGHLPAVMFLVEVCKAKISPYVWSENGCINSPIVVAAQGGYFNIVEYFIECINKKYVANNPIWEITPHMYMSHGAGAPAPNIVNKKIEKLVKTFFSNNLLLREQTIEILLSFDRRVLPALIHLQESKREKKLRQDSLLKIKFTLCVIDIDGLISLLKNASAKRQYRDGVKSAQTLLRMLGIRENLLATFNNTIKNSVVNMYDFLNNLSAEHFLFDSSSIVHNEVLNDFKNIVAEIEKITKKLPITKDGINKLVKYLIHKNALIRFAVKNIILQHKIFDNELLTNAILASYANANWRIRRDGIEVLSHFPQYTSIIVSHLLTVLKDKNAIVKQVAAIALIKKNHTDNSVLEILGSGLLEPNWKLRYHSVTAMKILSNLDAKLLEKLIECLIDEDKDVRKATLVTLKHIAKNYKAAMIVILNSYLFKLTTKQISLELIFFLRELVTVEDVTIGMFLIINAKDDQYNRSNKNVVYQAFLLLQQLFLNRKNLCDHLLANQAWYSLTAITNAISVLPEYKDQLFQNTIGIATNFRRFVSTVSDFKTALQLFADNKEVLLNLFKELVINDPHFAEDLSKISPYDLKDLVKMFPAAQSQIYLMTVGNADWFTARKRQYSYRISDLAEIFPQHLNDLYCKSIKDPIWFSKHVKELYDLIDAGSAFPEHGAELLAKTINNPAWFINIYVHTETLRKLAYTFSKQKALLIDKFINDTAWFTENVEDCDNLRQFAYEFEEQSQLLFDKTIGNEEWFSAHVFSTVHVEELIKIFPQQKQAIIAKTIESPIWFAAHVKNIYAVEVLLKLLPNQRDLTISKTINNSEWFSKHVKSIYNLEELVKLFPDKQDELYARTAGEASWFAANVARLYDLEEIVEIFTNKQDDLYAKTAGNTVWFSANVKDLYDLNNIAKIFSSKQDQLFAKIVGEKNGLLTRVSSLYNLESVVEAFPNQRQALFIQYVENNAWRTKNVTDVSDIKNLVKLFPAHKQAIFEKTAGDSSWFSRHITLESERQKLTKLFPEQKQLLLKMQNAPSNGLKGYQ